MTGRRRTAVPSSLADYVGVVAGAGVVVAVFLPWYAVNIGPPFSASTVSGWDATAFAKIAMALGVLVALASAAQVLSAVGTLRLERPVRAALTWAVVVAAVGALALSAFRLLVLPDPADLLSRQIGLYLAVGAAALAVLAGIGQLARDE